MLAEKALEEALPLAAKRAREFAVGVALTTVLPAALALVAPSWGSYIGAVLGNAVAPEMPIDDLASWLLAFAGQ
jgi:nucleotide-binding universal stress UspA family protein